MALLIVNDRVLCRLNIDNTKIIGEQQVTWSQRECPLGHYTPDSYNALRKHTIHTLVRLCLECLLFELNSCNILERSNRTATSG